MTSISSLTQSLSDLHFTMQRPHNKLDKTIWRDPPLPSQDRAKAFNTYVRTILALREETIPSEGLLKKATAKIKELQFPLDSQLSYLSRESESYLGSLSLPPYDLPQKPLHTLLHNPPTSLDRLKEEFAIATRYYSASEVFDHLETTYDFYHAPIVAADQCRKEELLPLPFKTHRFFHAHACGHHIHYGKSLGKGCYGEIKQATLDGMLFAAKIPLENDDDPRLAKQSFELEVCSLLKLKHHNILQLLAVGNIDKRLILFLELAHESLHLFLARHTKPGYYFRGIDMKRLPVIFSQIALALEHIHSKGMIHKDLTTGNVLLTKDGTVKIADFGIATLYNVKKKTQVANYIASPESLDHKAISSKCDIWAFGALLHVSFTKDWPYTKITIKKNGVTRQEKDCEYRLRLRDAFYKKTAEIKPLFQESGWEERDPDRFWRALIADCLNPLPENRPSAREIYERLNPKAT